MSKKNPFGFKSENLSRQKVLPSKEPKMSQYDHLKGYYTPPGLSISTKSMPFHLNEKN